jgi:hypothetical protein
LPKPVNANAQGIDRNSELARKQVAIINALSAGALMVGYEQAAAFRGQRFQAALHALKAEVCHLNLLRRIAICPGIYHWMTNFFSGALLLLCVPPHFSQDQASDPMKVAVGIGCKNLFSSSNSPGHTIDGFVGVLSWRLRAMTCEESHQAPPNGFIFLTSAVLVRIEPKQELSKALGSERLILFGKRHRQKYEVRTAKFGVQRTGFDRVPDLAGKIESQGLAPET